MGDLNIVKYAYTPEDISGSNGIDIAADLQTKLRALTGGGGGDGSKIRGWHCENVRGMFVFIICYES